MIRQLAWCILLATTWVTALPAGAQVVFGDCNAITNIDFGDPAKIKKFVSENYATADGYNIQFIVDITTCGEKEENPQRRLRLLILSLDQMLLMKHQFYIPALDRFIASPSAGNFQAMVQLGSVNIKRIEDAINKLVDLEASIKGRPLTSKRANSHEILDGLAQALASRLAIKLSTPLAAIPTFNPQLNEAQLVYSMQSYRDRYVEIVNDLDALVSQLKQAADQ